ncbi:MAG: TetR/AcrR family transcriptional regulator [Lachnospiraceae bacterium]|nr:TetR/AcrR family transcriptional regulator [Lachnospiraceae bacterium]
MFDDTQNKIIHATMELVMERGYTATTTKDIASRAGINECTIFRKFKGKKEIILSAMTLPEWNPCLRKEDFSYCGELEKDLLSFSRVYMRKVTPEMVKISMGLRTPELFPDTADKILEIPRVFKEVLTDYFQEMYEKGMLASNHVESMAMTVLSMNFGFVFLRASFGGKLTELEQEQYITDSVRMFVSGICKRL